MSAIDRLFDNISRIGFDSADMTNRHKQNVESANYVLENYMGYNSVTSAVKLSTQQPNVFMSGSSGGGINRNNIDIDSMLQLTKLSKGPERNVYQERMFSSVPYLGKGPSNVDIEAHIMNGDLNINRKSMDPNSEVSQINHIYYPLIPSLEARMNNPANSVEGVAAEGWIRGGIPSRILNRERE